MGLEKWLAPLQIMEIKIKIKETHFKNVVYRLPVTGRPVHSDRLLAVCSSRQIVLQKLKELQIS